MRIQLEVSEENEGTESPWWLIIDPRQMMKPDCYDVAHMITGPFFSRRAAETHLKNRKYAFSKRAVVYCHSGYWSGQYHYSYLEGTKTKKGMPFLTEEQKAITLDECIKLLEDIAYGSPKCLRDDGPEGNEFRVEYEKLQKKATAGLKKILEGK